MTDQDKPQTRAEARELTYPGADSDGLYRTLEPIELGEVVVDDPAFLPLGIRRVLYLIAIAALFAGPLIAVQLPEYGNAIVTGGNTLAAIAIGTALANPKR